jgi:hypothetical protein
MVVASPSSSSFEEAVQRSFRHASSFFDHENGCNLLISLKRKQVGDPRSARVERGGLSLKPLTHLRNCRCSYCTARFASPLKSSDGDLCGRDIMATTGWRSRAAEYGTGALTSDKSNQRSKLDAGNHGRNPPVGNQRVNDGRSATGSNGSREGQAPWAAGV